MKVYVVTDLEGVAGVYTWENRDDASMENHERRCRQRRWLAEEVNAAGDGFFAAGATEVLVNDGHGAGYTIDMECVDPRIRIYHGQKRPFYCVGLDERTAAIGSVGAHAKAGTANATLAHTMGKSVRGYWLNGISVGETGYQAFLAGAYGVPFVFCAGEAHACDEMAELVPGCVTVAVKEGQSELSAITTAPAKAREMIREGAAEAMGKVREIEPLHLESPVVFREEFHEPVFDPDTPPKAGRIVDPHTREIEAANMIELMYLKYNYDRTWTPYGRDSWPPESPNRAQ